MTKKLKALLDQTSPLSSADAAVDELFPWKDQVPLLRELPPPPEFPVAALGPTLSAATLRLREAVQAPLGLCAQSILAAATLAAQAHADVFIDGRCYPLSNNFISIGESGERKSGVDRWALQAHRRREEELDIQYEVDRRAYKIDQKLYEQKSKNLLSDKTMTAAERELELKNLKEPEPPLSPILLAEEPTYEGLVKLFVTGQPSLGLFSDEGGRFIGGHGMNQENQLKTAAGLSNLWDGKPISRVRAGEGSQKIFGKRLSTHLMVQPRVAGLLLGNDLMNDQGYVSRCLLCYPQSTAGERTYRSIDLTRDGDLRQYWSQMEKLLVQPPSLRSSGSRNELQPRQLRLTDSAKTLWEGFHNSVEQSLKPGGEYVLVRAFASKSAEHCLRIAGVLTLVEAPWAERIEDSSILMAIDVVDYYLREALRLYHHGQDSEQDELDGARKLLDWFREKGKVRVSVPEIYTSGPRCARGRDKTTRLMHVLYEHGYVRPLGKPLEYKGKTYRQTYEVRAHW